MWDTSIYLDDIEIIRPRETSGVVSVAGLEIKASMLLVIRVGVPETPPTIGDEVENVSKLVRD